MAQHMFDLFQAKTPRVFTIPPTVSFLDTFARTLLATLDQPDTPFNLSDALILLPTRRASRALSQAFLDAHTKTATLLPRIRTLGDLDPADTNLAELSDTLAQAPVVDPLARKLILARLIQARGKASDWSSDPAAALSAADALANLLDSAAMTASGESEFDWSKLDTLVTHHDLAQHWQQSTTFLSIITQAWPDYLRSIGKIDPGVHQRRNIEAIIASWKLNPPKHTVIIAGSTGSMAATRNLMQVVARLHKGAVILPGLDPFMTSDAWKAARDDDQHPQRGLAVTLEAIGIDREQVQVWPGVHETDALRNRRLVLNEALTPQASTADWPTRIQDLGTDSIAMGLEGICLIEAASEDEEASVIALELRKAIETPDKKIALITPSSQIARRVGAKMQRWSIQVDHSSGQALAETTIGSFIKLVVQWARDPAEPVCLKGLLYHPLTSLGLDRTHIRVCASALEISLLRGARKDDHLGDLIGRVKGLDPQNWLKQAQAIDSKQVAPSQADAIALLENLHQIWQEIGILQGPLSVIAYKISSLAERIATTPAQSGAQLLWRGEAGEEAARLLSALIEHGSYFGSVEEPAVERTLNTIMAGIVVRPHTIHPRIAILGPLEARLLHFDQVILAGLDEGVWPQPNLPDPFLSRAMRQDLGLGSVDIFIGLSAHDFAQFASTSQVTLTRSSRRNDAPSILSRWLWRLKTLAIGALGEAGAKKAIEGDSNWLELIRRHAPVRTFDPLAALPAPKPPIYSRPRAFHATEIETWIRDPYSIYVNKILKLRPLEPLGGPIGAGARGTAIHAGVEVIADWATKRPIDPFDALSEAFKSALLTSGYRGCDLEIELVRLKPSIAWLAHEEIERLKAGWHPLVERKGSIEIDTNEGPLTLSARADRIDVGPSGTQIIDFKSGQTPSAKQVKALFSAQLPVTALIAAKGGFKDPRITLPADLRHVRLGGQDVGYTPAVASDTNVAELIERVTHTLRQLSACYDRPERTYLSKPRVAFIKAANYEDPIDRLSRRAEWADAVGTE
ncbi:double-strand break repair protein AddB [Candidatus Phycosocius spiralis]|uniref:Double-strand break repair protein AddB n=1 Tax=Candidatus Phycosocius spiralis TaxID=2815099 RepID=A0ABQ4PXK6_9PROT|nr:double-strand break repair protein AddB [Candidatus Phycosocius spiralis]GIU67655.1 double-strand break repair protein AddB [Candidatus Phycosocius spiralis]